MSSQNLPMILALSFLGVLGLLQLFQQFGLLIPKDQRKLQNRTRDLHNLLFAKPGDKPSGYETIIRAIEQVQSTLLEQGQGNYQTLLNTVTQSTGLISEALGSSKSVLSLIESKDYGLRTFHPLVRDFRDQREETGRRFDTFAKDLSSLKAVVAKLQSAVQEQYNAVQAVHEVIKRKASAQLMERTYDTIKEVQSIVMSHDKSIKSLEEVHPSELGERPPHWCSAADVARGLLTQGSDTLSSLEGIKGNLRTLEYSLARLRDKENDGMSKDLDNFLKVVDLLSAVLSRVDNLHHKYEELIKLLEEENGDDRSR